MDLPESGFLPIIEMRTVEVFVIDRREAISCEASGKESFCWLIKRKERARCSQCKDYQVFLWQQRVNGEGIVGLDRERLCIACEQTPDRVEGLVRVNASLGCC